MRVMVAKDGVLIRRRLRIFVAAIALVLLCAVCVGGVSGETWDKHVGDTSWGSDYDTNSEFYIGTAEELAKFATMVNDNNNPKDFTGRTIYLTADIDLTAYSWICIGSPRYPSHPFKGTFDGQGHTISNIRQEKIGSREPGGLFGYVYGGTVTNVVLQGVEINVQSSPVYVGSLIGVLQDGTVTDCEISGYNIIKPADNVVPSGFSNSGNVIVDDVIGEIRGTKELIYHVTATTKMNIATERFKELDSNDIPTIDYKNGANHQDHGLIYEVTIPDKLTIGESGVGSDSLRVYNLRIPSSTVVRVYVSGDFQLEHQEYPGITLAYVLKNGAGTELGDNALVGEFTMASYPVQNQISLKATVLDTAQYSGSYSDTLTFTYGLEETA